MKEKINQALRILITLLPFLPLFLAVSENKSGANHGYIPIFEISAIVLIVFSIFYLLIEINIMSSKKQNKKVKFNLTLVLISLISFILIFYFKNLWR